MTDCEQSNLSVLHVGAGRYRPDDTSHSTFDIWREIAKGFRRYTAVGRSVYPQYAKFGEGNVDVRLLPSRMESEAEFLITQFKAEKIALEVKADVIVAQCPVQGGLVASRIARKRDAKILMEFHMGHYFEEKPLFSRNGMLEIITRMNLPHAHRIRVLSSGMRQKLITKFGDAYSNRIVILPPRVDLSRFSKVKSDWSINGRPKLVIVGTVNQRKGQLRFLKTLLPVNRDVEVWIVGNGPDLDVCKSYVESQNASEQVRFFGQLNHVQLADLLPKADAMLLFSSMEGTPRAIMEGMATGLPIITTNAGFCADVVENGVQGFVLGDAPTREVLERIDQLFGEDDLRSRMGRAARDRVETEFDAVVLYNKYRALIRDTAVT